MNAKDVKCPICGTVNRSLDLDETDGWMECESCHNAVQILKHAKSRRGQNHRRGELPANPRAGTQ